MRRPLLGEADEHFQNKHESNNGGDSAGEGDNQQEEIQMRKAAFKTDFHSIDENPTSEEIMLENIKSRQHCRPPIHYSETSRLV